MKNKGFSLIELLAVIIILGVLMLIAVPSVTNYINESRKESYVTTGKELIKGASQLVTKGKVDIDDPNTTYYIPYTCMNMDKTDKAKSPYGEFEEAYVVVTKNEDGSYDYYFYSKDEQGIGVYPITEEAALSAECIRTGIEDLSTNIGIGKRKNVKVYSNDCTSILEEKQATRRNPEVDENGNIVVKHSKFDTGSNINKKMKILVGNSDTTYRGTTDKIKRFVLSDEEPDDENKKANNKISTSNSEYPIYMWFDEDDGTMYWWSEGTYPYLNENSAYFFSGLTTLNSIDEFANFDTSKVTNFAYFFYCTGIEDIDLSNIDTSKVTSFSYMFSNCPNINEIDLSYFNTSKALEMEQFFAHCPKITHLDLSYLDVSKVTTMRYMFYGCKGIIEFDFTGFNSINVTDMSGMFAECEGLETIDLTGLRTDSVTNMGASSWLGTRFSVGMFEYCRNLVSINFGGINTSNVTSMGYMFEHCEKLKHLDLSSLNTPNLIDMYWIFDDCYELESVTFGSFNTSKVQKMDHMFRMNYKLTSVDLNNLNTSSVVTINAMFLYCTSLPSVDVSNWDTRKLESATSLFGNCGKLTTIDLSNWRTPRLNDMTDMFVGCGKLKNLNVSNLDTSHVTKMGWLFQNCYELVEIDLSSFDTSNVTDMRAMFDFCSKLQTIYVSDKFVTDSVTQANNMFKNSGKIKGGAGTTWNSSMISDKTYARIDGGPDSPGLFTLKTV